MRDDTVGKTDGSAITFRPARRQDVARIVELLADDQHVPIPQHLAATSRSLSQVLASLRERTPGSPVAITPTAAQLDDCGWVANRWCELLPVPLELKQRLMQLDTPLVRLELVGDVLERTGIAPL